MSVASSPASCPTHTVMRPRLRPLARPALVAFSCLGLTACTAHMDMTISPQGSYDVALEMRDTTGTIFPQDKAPDCSAYSDPTALGVPAGTTVKAEPLTGDDGPGCSVSISGVKVPQAAEAEPNTIVVRDGDVYKVTIQPLSLDPQDSGGADGAAGAPGAAPEATADPSGGQGEPQPSSTSFRGVVDTKVSITFPGAVTQSGGGKVSGTTVTWDDPDTVAKGVSASGYAQDSRGVSWWSRTSVWLTAGLVLLGGVLAAGVMRRRAAGRATLRRRTREKQEE
ncbi:translation initiation factor 2 [Actinomyces sp. ZJ308]|uniref:LppM family (lipo)protein n=1 Tax=Actinomyces sp. ZJ308 TaxID=2708342 RepID=UPI001420E286|nr:translation initiation factor 2 [Actinomyces sp. ZJ308]